MVEPEEIPAATLPLVPESAPLTQVDGRLWTPVRVRPRREKKLAEYSRRKAVPYYLPLRHHTRRYQRRSVEFLLPMFPGYVFCAVDEDAYGDLLLSGHVAGRLAVDAAAERRLVAELNELRIFTALAQSRELIVMPELVVGVKVLVRSGPLRGVSGIITRRKQATLVAINIELLGQSIAAEVDVGELELES